MAFCRSTFTNFTPLPSYNQTTPLSGVFIIFATLRQCPFPLSLGIISASGLYDSQLSTVKTLGEVIGAKSIKVSAIAIVYTSFALNPVFSNFNESIFEKEALDMVSVIALNCSSYADSL